MDNLNEYAPVYLLKEENGIEWIRKQLLTYPDEVIYIAIGPLTSLALLLKTYEDTHGKFQAIHIMGGNDPNNYENLTDSEFNFVSDPEAVDIVFRNAGVPIKILPWETCSPPLADIPLVRFKDEIILFLIF